jgi:hypothetical protein
MRPCRLYILGGRPTASQTELVAAISSATGWSVEEATRLDNLLRSTPVPAEFDASATSAEMTKRLAKVLDGYGFKVLVETRPPASTQLALWTVAVIAFASAFWLPTALFAGVVPLLPLFGLGLIFWLHRVLLAFDHTIASGGMANVAAVRQVLERFINAPIWLRRIVGVLCIGTAIGLFIIYHTPRTANPAPQTDGREPSSHSYPPSPPAVGRER